MTWTSRIFSSFPETEAQSQYHLLASSYIRVVRVVILMIIITIVIVIVTFEQMLFLTSSPCIIWSLQPLTMEWTEYRMWGTYLSLEEQNPRTSVLVSHPKPQFYNRWDRTQFSDLLCGAVSTLHGFLTCQMSSFRLSRERSRNVRRDMNTFSKSGFLYF